MNAFFGRQVISGVPPSTLTVTNLTGNTAGLDLILHITEGQASRGPLFRTGWMQMMTRACGCLCIAALFLAISPKIRQTTLDGIGPINHQLELYAPYSYIGVTVLVLLVLMMSFYRGAQPR